MSDKKEKMICVILESPAAGDEKFNTQYARTCMLDCLSRGEAPIVSRLLYQVFSDNDEIEQQLSINAGLAWRKVAEKVVVYVDLGLTDEMKEGIDSAIAASIPVEYRTLRK